MIHNLMTALQRQLQRSDIVLTFENENVFVLQQPVNHSKQIKMFLRGLQGGPLDFLEGRGVGDLV